MFLQYHVSCICTHECRCLPRPDIHRLLELQEAVSRLLQVQGTELGDSESAAHILNH